MSDFNWLLIDSCGAAATMAVGTGDRVVAAETLPGRAFSAEWPGALRRLVAEAGWPPAGLQAVGVVHGPGSFTGVRVGLAAAKGLCEAVGAKLIAISRLEVLAESSKNAAGGDGILAVLDAGRGEFYVRDGGEEHLSSLEEMIASARGRVVATWDARVAEVVTAEVLEESAVMALPLLMQRWRGGQFDDVATIDANYVRAERDIYGRKPAGRAGAQ